MLALLDDLFNFLVQPLRSLNAVARVEVAVVEGREFLELLLHGLGLDFADHLCDVGLVGEFGGVGGGEGHEAGCWAVVLPFCDVEEVDVVLNLLVVANGGRR